MKNLIKTLTELKIKHREYYTGPHFEFMEVFIHGNTIRITPESSQYTVERSGYKPKKYKTEKELAKLVENCLHM